MNPDRWEKMEFLIEQVLELPPEEREAFLIETCGTDDELRDDIKLLIQNSDSAYTFVRNFKENIVKPSLNEIIQGRREVSYNKELSFIDKIIGNYKITELLGTGGMGVVYKAMDTRLVPARIVALKFLPARALHNEEKKKRMLREARVPALINHPNIAAVYETGEIDGHTYIVMEYVSGVGLDEKIALGPIPVREILGIAIQVAKALRAAHEKGIIHRDLKSSNIIISGKGTVKLMDFGLAKMRDDSNLTKEGTMMGTFPYMSPEQVRGKTLDYRTDIWSLGVVLYEMITNKCPFQGGNPQSLMYQILNEEPEPVMGVRANLPPEVGKVITQAMQKDKNSRYQNLNDLILDLQLLIRKTESDEIN